MYNFEYIDFPLLHKTQQEASINHFSDEKLACQILDNATLLPFKYLDDNLIGGGVLTQTGEHFSVIDTGEERYDFSEKEVENKDVVAVYLGLFHPKWGHCITDNIKKLWFLFTPEYEKLKSDNIQLVYTVFDGFQLNGNFLELLSLLGVDLKLLNPIEKATKFKKLYIPDDSFFQKGRHRYYTEEFKSLLNRIPKLDGISKYDKVYFTRTAFSGADYGEKDVEKFFKKLGYKIIAPEKLSFKEQLSVLSNCNTFASTEGSIAHNSLFLKENSTLIVIRKADYINSYQFPINELKNLKVTYIDAHLSIFNHQNQPWIGPFFMYVNDNMQRFSSSNSYLNSFKLKEFMVYTKEAFLLEMENRRNADMFYYNKLKQEILKLGRNKYKKLANKICPNLFPWKL